jgi:translation elongation factor EF-G
LKTHDAARSSQRSSHPEYPLERVCSYASEPFQLTFARNARQHFLTREDVAVVASHSGLTIRAETEAAIDAALALLKDLYGPRLHIGPPTVLYHQGVMLEQPWMGLRVRCPVEHLEAVNADLLDRDATILACRIDGTHVRVEARAPLASLLGYGASLEILTAGAARHSLWLSHYAPLVPEPPGGHAA